MRVWMRLPGANDQVKVEGIDQQRGKSNYFVGNHAGKWKTQIPHYSKVRYSDLYPGIDLLFYAESSGLEFDFVVKPGADPRLIVLDFPSAPRLDIDPKGNLVLDEARELVLLAPHVYQVIDGNRSIIESQFRLLDKHRVAFQVGVYNAGRLLVIDPVLRFKSFGGSSDDSAFGIALDGDGNRYVTGFTFSPDFCPPPQTCNDENSNLGTIYRDAFVSKLSPDGSLLYSTYFGGTNLEWAWDIAVDDSGKAYVAGETFSGNFPTLNPSQACNFEDAFVVGLDATGSLFYSTCLGGSFSDNGRGIALDPFGGILVTGFTRSSDFPISNAFQPEWGSGDVGASDSFVTKLDPSLEDQVVYSSYLGGDSRDVGFSIAADSLGNAYVTGETLSETTFPTENPFQSIGSGEGDAFVTKIGPLGQLLYSTYLGGPTSAVPFARRTVGFDIAVDDAGHVYVTGTTLSPEFTATSPGGMPLCPTQDAFQTTQSGLSDVFVTKIDPTVDGPQEQCVYSTYLGGTGGDFPSGIAVDADGNVTVVGTGSEDYPLERPLRRSISGLYGSFVSQLNASGSALDFSTYFAGSLTDVAVDPSGIVHVTGLIIGPGLLGSDVLVASLDPNKIQGAFLPSDPFDSRTSCAYEDRDQDGNLGLEADDCLIFERRGNRILVSRSSQPEVVLRVILLLNSHPVTGRPQDIVVIDPNVPEPASSGTQGWFRSKIMQGMVPTFRKTEASIDGYEANFRPKSVTNRTDFTDAVRITSTLSVQDGDGDGLSDSLEVKIPMLPDMEIGIELLASTKNTSDYARLSLPLPGPIDFLPLGDTNGDGVPDSPALDFDGDNLPDSDTLLLPFLAGTPNPAVELAIHFAQFGDGSVGEANVSSLISLFNLDPDNPARVKILLKGDDGRPLTVDLNGEEAAGEKEIEIPAGGLVQLATDGQGPLISGSVIVRSDRAVAGVILFAGVVGTAGVGVSHVLNNGFVAPIQTSEVEEISTGVAISNLQVAERSIALTLCDENGMLLATGELMLAAMGHRALFVDEIEWVVEEGVELDLSTFVGILKTTEGQIAATVIQTRPGELATLPVAPNYGETRFVTDALASMVDRSRLGAEPDLNQKMYFAQFGNGGEPGSEVLSQILLLNLTQEAANARVLIKGDDGNPLTVTLNGELMNGQTDLLLPQGSLRTLQSDGIGELISGSVAVCSDQALAGVVLFSGGVGTAGVGTSAVSSHGLEAPLRTRLADQIRSGIALVNVEDSEQMLALRLSNDQNRLLATSSIDLSALGHRALFLEEIEWQVEEGKELDFEGFSGLIKIEAAGRIAGTVIETRPGVFATLPVVPSLD